MNVKALQKERTRASIIASACELLRERGIGGARVADVMSAAGLTVGGFYAHFPSKEALVDEALRRTSERMRARLFERIEEKPAAARAEVIFKRYLSAAHRDEPKDGCSLPAVAGEVATTAREHGEVLAEQLEVFADGIAEHLGDGEASATRTKATKEEKRGEALAMLALMVGGLTLARAVRGTPLSDEVIAACRAFWKRGHR